MANEVLHHYDKMTHTVSVRYDKTQDGLVTAVRVGVEYIVSQKLQLNWIKYIRFRVGQLDFELAEDSVDVLGL